MKTGRTALRLLLAGALVGAAGCLSIPGLPGSAGDNTTLSELATKAVDIADQIGGDGGFGGSAMTGYREHGPSQMGFLSEDDLATADQTMLFHVRNEADQDAEFHVSYIASHMGLTEQMMDVTVSSNGDVTVELPCAEIVGVGSVASPGEPGCHLDDGQAIPNTMFVPGFLGQDFVCGQTYGCVLTQDVDDLDGDGDREEYVIVSDGFEFHMLNGGPAGHRHGTGFGMMGSHMGM